MRTIKFRAWDKEQKRFINADTLLLSFSGEILNSQGRSIDYADRYDLMQFTGLLDKNGKEIYEGDILRVHDNEIVVVEWREDARFEYKPDAYNLGGWHDQSEVIGNIYSNPELLN